MTLKPCIDTMYIRMPLVTFRCPEWLHKQAKKLGINISEVCRQALINAISQSKAHGGLRGATAPLRWCGRRDSNPGPLAREASVLDQARRRPPLSCFRWFGGLCLFRFSGVLLRCPSVCVRCFSTLLETVRPGSVPVLGIVSGLCVVPTGFGGALSVGLTFRWVAV